MDTIMTSPASDAAERHLPDVTLTNHHVDADTEPEKISAYYSLVFPNYTFYVQTLSISIGRRSVRPGIASTSESPQVDLDLGPLKNVSRLHARVEYDEPLEQFVLVVLGRNGAWVDGVWSGSGSRVPLNARSQIQIATRIFQFVPPPPAPVPEDSPTPSTPTSSTRHLSPSIDVTSLSPDSSLPSPPAQPKELPPQAPIKHPHDATVPAEKPQTKQSSAKKRKKPGSEPRPLPDVMPPRPGFTYAQLCYRAIKSMDGKATLQEICGWVSDNFDWYRYNEGSGWDSSIRHNLSSNKAFKKLERCAGERGKGFFWSVDPEHEHLFEDIDSKGALPHSRDGAKHRSKAGKGAATLDPPLRRSVKGETKVPLPPPLTSTPLPSFSSSSVSSAAQQPIVKPDPSTVVTTIVSTPQDIVQIKQESGLSETTVTAPPPNLPTTHPTVAPQPPQTPSPNQTAPAASSLPELSEDVIVPIVIGPPSPTPSTSNVEGAQSKSSIPDLSSRAIVLKDNTIILSPTIFSWLTAEQLKELEALGARKAIEILRGHIVRFLKEKIKTEGAKGKGKKRSKKDKSKANGDVKPSSGQADVTAGPSNDADNSTTPTQNSAHTSQTKPKKAPVTGGPFTTAPLPQRKPVASADNSAIPTAAATVLVIPSYPLHPSHIPFLPTQTQQFSNLPPAAVNSVATVLPPNQPSPPPMGRLEEPMEHISITDEDEPAAKKPRLDTMEIIEVV